MLKKNNKIIFLAVNSKPSNKNGKFTGRNIGNRNGRSLNAVMGCQICSKLKKKIVWTTLVICYEEI